MAGELELLPPRTLTHVVGHDSLGLGGRASIVELNSFILGPNHIRAKDRGVVADGVTDVRAQLRALLVELEALGGGVLELDYGTYLLGSPANSSEGGLMVSNLNPRIWIVGMGMDLTILKAADGLTVAMTGIIRTKSGTPQSNFMVSDLTIDGNRANNTLTTVGFYCGVSPNDPANVVLSGQDNTIATFTYQAAHGRTVGQQIFIDSWTQPGLVGNFTIATVPTSTTFTIVVPTGLVNENNVPTYKTTFDNLYDNNIFLHRVKIKNCKKGGTSGGYAFDPHEMTVNLVIDNCVAHDNDGPAVALDGCRKFFVRAICYNNEGAAVEGYTRTRDGIIEVTGENNGNNNGGSPIASVGFESNCTNISCHMALVNARGNGVTVAFGASNIRLTGSIENIQHHGIHLRGATNCTVDVVITDAGQAANNTYNAVYCDNGQLPNGYINANNTVKGLKVIQTKTNKLKYAIENNAGCTENTFGPNIDVPLSAVQSGIIEDAGIRTRKATVRSAGGMHPGWVASRWYGPYLTGGLTDATPVADRVYFIPVWIPPGSRINRYAFEVSTVGSASTTWRMAIYNGFKGIPGDLVVDLGTFIVTTGSIGSKTFNPADVRPYGGFCYLALVGNGAVTMPILTGKAADPNGINPLLYGYTGTNLRTGTPVATPTGGWYCDAPNIITNGFPTIAPAFNDLFTPLFELTTPVPVALMESGN